MIDALSWKLYFEVSELNEKKTVCAGSLNAKRHQAEKVHRHKSSTGTDVIMGLDEFSKANRKLDHNPYGKRENMKVIRRKKPRKDILLNPQHPPKKKKTL